jgi:hypothetical protein
MPKKLTGQHTTAITKRFLLLMNEVLKDGLCATKGDFAGKIGEYQQNFPLMEQGIRAPTLEQLATACKVFGYSPTWLILGAGEKKLKAAESKTIETRLTELETEMAAVKRMLKKK